MINACWLELQPPCFWSVDHFLPCVVSLACIVLCGVVLWEVIVFSVCTIGLVISRHLDAEMFHIMSLITAAADGFTRGRK